MSKYVVELVYGLGITVAGISANNRDEAIEIAKRSVQEGTMITPISPEECSVDYRDLEFEQVSYVGIE